jgi:hypothetical protein
MLFGAMARKIVNQRSFEPIPPFDQSAAMTRQGRRFEMYQGWHEVEKLTTILEAEYSGQSIDSAEAHGLALKIAQIYPDVRRTMDLIVDRMAERRAAVA